ncbi:MULTISPECIES: UDP-glucose 4-epimerase GalE [Planktothrix]|jgi:UDP-glucose 4-epimerase|nr:MULTISPECIES: UDP-glucose 4-epimerase GalE [Planktothrix]CAD5949794.1 UDP-glucose 4-epimerase [Planktothrix rubescens]CAC5344414.1 UDP-glucose 4-epimerase [Planktothrix rubescens NIVA-CYA 18]CAD5916697.1 UDP-glucose 4-epimerase [Planktothrix rubescens NIVA-CYA 18]CAD5942109.1 UDP-glucose 4-epimerase [Planktothrix agardhii]CAH2570956.1 UDP-glucose 4-epimerase [Planktothrix rubescens]
MQTSKKILVTGGAGYIGSHVVKQLGRETDYEIVVYDNLSTGSPKAVLYGELVVGDLADLQKLAQVFAEHQFDAVLHFAASISVPESTANPLAYYGNNTRNTLNLLQCCETYGVKKLVFSSTAAVYGETAENPVRESTPTTPINPYGYSKLMSEQMIQDYSRASGLKYIILRYFNVAGADDHGRIGQTNKKASHLLKVALDAALNRRESVSIFGTDFPTPDGTGIRDYIHVEDLAAAHIDALRYLKNENESHILNCGYGQGYSVKEVLAKVTEMSGRQFPVIEIERRAGDPACVIACSDKIRQILGWKPQFNSLEKIVSSALAWELKLMYPEELVKKMPKTPPAFVLGTILLQKQFISRNQLQVALQEQANTGKKLGEILLRKSMISDQTLQNCLQEQFYLRQRNLLAS